MAKSKENKEEGADEIVPSRSKLTKKSFSLSDFKSKLKVSDSELKEITWLPLSKAFQQETSLEGIPIGELTLIRGYSDTSKSSLMYEAMVSAQTNGYLPIIIDTENAMKKEYLTNLGFDFDGDYLYIDSDYLVTNYGKKYNKDFSVPSIEDVSEFINEMLDKQESGELPMDIVIGWDSAGSCDSRKSLTAKEKDKEANNMWNAGAMEQSFKGICHHRIPSTRKINRNNTATLICVQKVWFDSQSGGQGTLRHKGGEALYSFSRLIIHAGGVKSRGVQKVSVIKNKKTTVLGSLVPIKIAKNHVSNLTFDGTIFITAYGTRLQTEVNDFKNEKLNEILKDLGESDDSNLEIVTEIDDNKE